MSESGATSGLNEAMRQSGIDSAELLRRVDAVLAEPIYWFGVRHHSPTAARMLAAAIADRRPKVIFVEASAEMQSMVNYITDARTRPPIAVYCSYRDDAAAEELLKRDPLVTPPRQSVWYPLVSYSPEYVAMREAKRQGAEVVFFDLPHYAIGRQSPQGSRQPIDLDELVRRSDFYQLLARAAGHRSWDETWDTLFESPRDASDYEAYRRDVTIFCAGVRATTPAELLQSDGTLERERFMWQTVGQTLADRKLKPADAMIVCGGFHVLLDQADPVPPPPIPAGTVSVTLAPYSYFRVSGLSGYGAGNRAPRFYELLHEHHANGADHTQVVIDHVAAVVKEARRLGEALSTADSISATQHALLLARLRGRRFAVLDDIQDAVITCCVKGDPRTEAVHVQEAFDEINIGTRLGKVTDRLGRLPIVIDFYEQLDRLELTEIVAREKVMSYTLDRRQPADAARSAFFHRLAFLGVELGGVQREAAPFGQSIFKEQWRVKWDPRLEPALIEKNLHGDSIVSAATTLLREKLGRNADNAADAMRQVVEAIDMDLPLLIVQADESAGHAIDHDDRFRSLSAALTSLLMLEQYAGYRGLGKDRLADLIARCFDRACFAIPEVAAVPEDQWDEVVQGLLALAEPVLQRQDLDAELFAASVDRAAKASTMPFLRGAFLGVLTEMKRLKPDDLAAEMSNHAKGPVEQQIVAGDFLHGVLRVSRTAIMVGATSLVKAVDELLQAAGRDTFLSMLPKLRAAFEALHARQRDGVAEKVAEVYGLRESRSLRTLHTSVGAARLMAELDAEVAAIMEDWIR